MTGPEFLFVLAVGAAMRHFTPGAYRWLCDWAERRRYDVDATQRRIDRGFAYRPRSIPEPVRLRLVRGVFDQDASRDGGAA